ncbi:hypothetical protein [Pseudoxanthomonas kaohsiungensis]|uniref:Protein sip-5 n=1 Tax=Pseudoxanthomonas kaohsiungensis TaxID=283923 RepID=A0ABW3LZH4_9GAMM|nr:hypothetical protein [Pseudoxanthomonas kaohsiungensis]KAF1700888.1 hypothetical protein CSC66_15130 [Pseudoxanthomonas kaohsiungensis]
MRFEVLRQRVERAETRVESCMDRAYSHRQVFREAWRRGWTPGRIVVAGLLSGFLVGRAEPLSKVGGARWLQMLGTVSTMLASLRAAAASEEAGEAADAAADVAAEAAVQSGAAGPVPAAGTAPAATVAAPGDGQRVRAPSPAEAATEVSER